MTPDQEFDLSQIPRGPLLWVKHDGKAVANNHSHYFKDVSHLKLIDVYRVLDLFGVTDQAIGHAAKKLLVAGGRGHKDINKDIQDVIDTLERWKQMRSEDKAKEENGTTIERAGNAAP
jgi:hypothetical protein